MAPTIDPNASGQTPALRDLQQICERVGVNFDHDLVRSMTSPLWLDLSDGMRATVLAAVLNGAPEKPSTPAEERLLRFEKTCKAREVGPARINWTYLRVLFLDLKQRDAAH